LLCAPLCAPLLLSADMDRIPVTPLAFEPNVGQADARVKFLARAPEATLWLTERGVRLGGMGIRFEGGNANPKIESEEPQPGISNYFTGNDRSRWHTRVPHFSKVRYRDAYPGIDVVFYGNPGQLEYDFVLRPGADPSRIRLTFDGIERLSEEGGNLVLKSGSAQMRNLRPAIQQDGKPIGGRWVVRGKRSAGFVVDSYDRSRPLVSDPVMTYASLLGGTGPVSVTGIAIDPQGNIVVCGNAASESAFPTQNALYPTFSSNPSGAQISYVAKFNPAASGKASLVYSTYFDANGSQVVGSAAYGVAVDQSGNAYFVGTAYGNLPIQNALPQGSGYNSNGTCVVIIDGNRTSGACEHGYVAELSPSGATLLFSSYLEGSEDDQPEAIAVDSAGNIYVAGITQSQDFPVTQNAVQSLISGHGTYNNSFVTKIAPAHTIQYSTFFGASGAVDIFGVAADAHGNIYICGTTLGAGLPVSSGAFQAVYPGNSYNPTVGFVAVLNPSAQPGLVYGSYLGGSNSNTVLNAVTADAAGNIYAVGFSEATDFPVTPGAIRGPTTVGNAKAVAVKLNPSAQGSAQLVYSTILGGSYSETASGIALDASGHMTIVGTTMSPDFPATANAFQPYYGGEFFSNGSFSQVGYLAQIDPTKSGMAGLIYSTFVGGTASSNLTAVALDAVGKTAAVGGATLAGNSPVTSSAFQTNFAGTEGNPDAFVARFDLTRTGALSTFVENGASLSADAIGALSPGLIFTLKGTGLGPTAAAGGIIDSSTGKVSTSVQGVQVLVHNVPCPLLYISATQINAIAPFALANVTQPVAVQAVYNGVPGNVIYMPVAATAPGIFSFDDGAGQGAILNQDGSVNGASNPAARGSVVQIFATGGGQTVPAGVDGAISTEPLGQIPAPAAKVTLTIGGVTATLDYAGSLPQGVAGALQINAVVPASVTPGSAVPVVLTIGANASPKTLTMAVN